MIHLNNAKIVLEDKIIETDLTIENGKIKKIGKAPKDIDLSGLYIAAGFIDQHIHGASSSDFMDGTSQAFDTISRAVLKEGTTALLATTMTASISHITAVSKVLSSYKNKYANILGMHLEGPFINKIYKGAQPEEFIIKPSLDLLNLWHPENIKIISMAPEVDEENVFIDACIKKGVKVSFAHSNAKRNLLIEAVEKGANGITHAYNAMSGLHHRDIGMVGTMLLEDKLYAEIICDGIHVSPDAVKLLYKIKGKENIILITDSMRAKYEPEGLSELGGQDVYIKHNQARLSDGTLAGSIIKMNDAVRNMMNFADINLVDAIYMATVTPAKNLNVFNRKGSIDVGKDADLVVLDPSLEVIMTIVGGKIKYHRENI